MSKEIICPICGKPIKLGEEAFEFVKGGICDASGMVYLHTKCYRKELRHDKR